MNNLEKLLQDAIKHNRCNTLIDILSFSTPCEKCAARESCEDDCVISRAKWLLEEYAEPDSWEKIEEDAKKEAGGGGVMEELKPCPFCGCEEIEFTHLYNNAQWIYCPDCGASTARYLTDEKAIEAWNRRANDADQR